MSHSIKVVSGLLASFVVLAACDRHRPDPRQSPPLVRVAVVADSDPSERAFTGVVSARVQSDLGFRVPGKIVARLVNAGEVVKRGQPLMRIDRTDYTLAAAARANAVEAARARARQTAADEKRCRMLAAAGAMSASAYDSAKASADSAAADLRAAEAQIAVARDEVSYSELDSDADGVVVETLAEPGQVVTAGQTVVRLAHAGPREAVINLPETSRPALASMARSRLYSGAGAIAAATLRQLSSSTNPVTRTYEARYVLQGAAADSPLGVSVTIFIDEARNRTTTQVPISALYDTGEGPGIWVVEGREPQVRWHPVKIAGVGEESAAVSSGLVSGERVVTLGAHLLHEGERVRVDPQREVIN